MPALPLPAIESAVAEVAYACDVLHAAPRRPGQLPGDVGQSV